MVYFFFDFSAACWKPLSSLSPFEFHPQMMIWSAVLIVCNPFPSFIFLSTRMEAIVPEMMVTRIMPLPMIRMPMSLPAQVTGTLSP